MAGEAERKPVLSFRSPKGTPLIANKDFLEKVGIAAGISRASRYLNTDGTIGVLQNGAGSATPIPEKWASFCPYVSGLKSRHS